MTQPDDTAPFSFDQSRFDALFNNMQESFVEGSRVGTKALDTALALNKEISAFYERLLLFNTGVVGVSVSALLSFGSRPGVLGHSKYFVVVIVSLGWGSLLLSITFCRSIMMHILAANRKLYSTWLHDAVSFNGSVITANTVRLSTSIKGIVDQGDEKIDLAVKFTELEQLMTAEFEKAIDDSIQHGWGSRSRED